jgi:hypothetical protein
LDSFNYLSRKETKIEINKPSDRKNLSNNQKIIWLGLFFVVSVLWLNNVREVQQDEIAYSRMALT